MHRPSALGRTLIPFLITVLIVAGFSWSSLPVSQAANSILYVNAAATGANNGSSWADAYTNLRIAIAAAEASDQIWVASGIYTPTLGLGNPLDRSVSFTLKDDLAIYGGFAGTETALAERDWESNLTILSGDLADDDQTTAGVVTDTNNIVGSNSAQVLATADLDSTALLDGFIVTAGYGYDIAYPKYQGGGMYNDYSSPTLRNVRFVGNYATNGGAMYNDVVSSPTLMNVSFEANGSYYHGAGIYNANGSNPVLNQVSFIGNKAKNYGGGMYNTSSNPTLTNVSFSGNSANSGGGGMYNTSYSSPTLTNVSFSGNSATDDGGGMGNFDSSNPTLTNVSFSGNSASNGGGMFNFASSSPMLTNVSFSGNSASNGGGMYNTSSSSTLTNVSFSGNSASSGGGIRNYNSSNLIIRNSILWGNSSSIVNSTSTPKISYSLVEGCNPGGSWSSSCGTNVEGNLADIDPQFVTAIDPSDAPTSDGDAGLQAESPVVNQGNIAFNSTPTDLAGAPRIVDTIDLGAYESQFVQLVTATVGSGSISPNPLLAWYPVSSTVTLTATANAGWSFSAWSGDLSGTSSPSSLSMTSTRVVTATFSNDPPTADAGTDQSAVAGSSVSLDGTGSTDADSSQTLTYGWTQSGGISVALSDPSAASPSFTAPTTTGLLTFTLTVTDDLGLASTSDSVTITVTNDAPVADAGADQSAVAGSSVTLDGSGSNDPDGHTPLTYGWTQTGGTSVALSDPSAASPSFTAPTTTGLLTFTLTVTDDLGLASSADTVTITVTNGEPVANAGVDQSVIAGSSVILDGSGSSDPDGHTPLSYAWTQTGGTSVTLIGSTTVSPSFIAPSSSGVLTFTLTVTDSMGLVSASDTVTVEVVRYQIALPLINR